MVVTSAMVKETAQMLEMLPENQVKTVNDLVKLLVLAWDPDFTKVTEEERSRMEIADEEMRKGIFFSEADVWGE